MEMAFLGSVDEPDVVAGVDLQPFQDRRQIAGDAAALEEQRGHPPSEISAQEGGTYSDLSEMTGLRTLVTQLAGSVAAEAARSTE